MAPDPPAPPDPLAALVLPLLVLPLLVLVELVDPLVVLDEDVGGGFPQIPEVHTFPMSQSVPSSLTTCSQPVSPHRSNLHGSLWVQSTGAGVTQLPEPSQSEGPVYEKPGAPHWKGMQTLPAAAGPHVPSTPPPFAAALQAWQGSVQAVLQHTLSTQNPPSQSAAVVHAAAGAERSDAAIAAAMAVGGMGQVQR